MSFIRLLTFLLTVPLLLMGCGPEKKSNAIPEPGELSVERVEVSPEINVLSLEQTAKLSVRAFYANGTSQDVSNEVDWSQIESDFFSINSVGKLTPVKLGEQTIEIEYRGKSSNSVKVIISPSQVLSLDIEIENNKISKGSNAQLKAIATLGNREVIDVSHLATWEVSNKGVVSIDDNTAVIKGINEGLAKVNAIYMGVASDYLEVEVTKPKLELLQIQPTSLTTLPNNKENFQATALYSDGSIENVTSEVFWESSDVNLAKFEKNFLSAISPGEVKVKATLDGIESKFSDVNISNLNVVDLKVSPSVSTINKHTQQELVAHAVLSNEVYVDVSKLVTYTVDENLEGVISIDDGIISAGDSLPGADVTIEVSSSYNSVSGNKVTVLYKPLLELINIKLSPVPKQLYLDDTHLLLVTGEFSDLSESFITNAVLKTSDESIIRVEGNGLLKAVGNGSADVWAEHDGIISKKHNITVVDSSNENNSIVDFNVSPIYVNIHSGLERQLSSEIELLSGEVIDVTNQTSWLVTDQDIAEIGVNTGSILGKKTGEVNVIASYRDLNNNKTIVNVSSGILQEIVISSDKEGLYIGESSSLKAIGLYSDGKKKDITNTVQWKSEINSGVSINSSGIVIAHKEGVHPVWADASGISSNKLELNVDDEKLTAIELFPKSLIMHEGESRILQAKGYFSNGDERNISDLVNWKVSDETIATKSDVNSNGLTVIGSSHGDAFISASLGIVTSDISDLFVLRKELKKITVSPELKTVIKGGKAQFKATGEYSDGSEADITNVVNWRSGDPSIVSIDSSGRALGISQGSTNVYATKEGIISNNSDITVSPASITSIKTLPEYQEVNIGYLTHYRSVATLSDNSTIDVTEQVTWESTDTTIASISNIVGEKGKVIPKSKGTSRIHSSYMGVKSNDAYLKVDNKVAVKLEVEPQELNIVKGAKEALKAIVTFSDGSTLNVTNHVNWLTSTPNEIDVSASGTVTGKRQGVGNVHAIYDSIISNDAKINILDAEIVSIQTIPLYEQLNVGTSAQFKAMALLSDGTTLDVTSQVLWESSNINEATVSNDLLTKGIAEGIKKGKVKVSASYNGIYSNQSSLVVNEKIALSLTISPSSIITPKGTSQKLTAQVRYSDGTMEDVTNDVNWKSQNNFIASINASGFAQALNYGNTSIYASFNNIDSNLSSFETSNATINSLDISPNYLELKAGLKGNYQAFANLSDGTVVDVTNSVSWSSSDNTIVSIGNGISNKGEAIAQQVGSAKIFAEHSNVRSNDGTVIVNNKAAKSVNIYPKSANLIKGSSKKLTAEVTYTDGSVQDVTNNINWISGNENVLYVDASGVAIGLDTGESNVVAHFDGIASLPSNIQVLDPEIRGLEIQPSSWSLQKGDSFNFKAIATMSDGSQVDVSSLANWTHSHPETATLADGYVVAMREGITNLEASFDTFNSSGQLVVISGSLTHISIENCGTTPIPVGRVENCEAVAYYSDGNRLNITNQSTWSSGNPTVLAVGKQGEIKGLEMGTTQVKVKYLDEVYQINITVSGPILESLTVTPGHITMPQGEQHLFNARGHYSDGSIKDVTNEVTWLSNDTSVANIDSTSGVATAIGVGTTTVFSSFEGIKSNEAQINVTNSILESITIYPHATALPIGFEKYYRAIGHYSDGNQRDITNIVTWTSSNTSIGEISSLGKFTAKSVGETNITATLLSHISNEVVLTVVDEVLTAIQVSPNNASALQGTTIQYKALGIFSSGSNMDITESVIWSSDNTSVATISNLGNAAALASGVANINAELNGISSSPVSLGVIDLEVTELTITPSSIVVPRGFKQAFKATATLNNGTEVNITDNVVWRVTEHSPWIPRYSIVGSIDLHGNFDAINRGSAKVEASFSGLSTEAIISVIDPTIVDIKIVPETERHMFTESQTQLKAVAEQSNGEYLDISNSGFWSVTDSALATISNTGNLYSSTNEGTVYVYIRYQDIVSAPLKVEIEKVRLQNISLKSPQSLRTNQTADLTVTAYYSDGSEVDVTSTATYSYEGNEGVKFNDKGVLGRIRGWYIGETQINAHYQGKTDSAPITIDQGVIYSTFGYSFYAPDGVPEGTYYDIYREFDGILPKINEDRHCENANMFGIPWIKFGYNANSQAPLLSLEEAAKFGLNSHHHIAGSLHRHATKNYVYRYLIHQGTSGIRSSANTAVARVLCHVPTIVNHHKVY